MATFAIRPIAPVKRVGDEVFITRPAAAGESFIAGALLVDAGSGEIEECAADPTEVAAVALAGVEDYSFKEDTFGFSRVSVPAARADQEFRGTLKGTFAVTDIGTDYGVVKEADGTWVVDKSEITATVVTIIGVDDEVEAGDVNVPVRFVIKPSVRQVIG